MKTYSAKESDINRNWFVVDAGGKTLGRLASRVASILRGKHKAIFTPHVDTGDYVIVLNAENVHVTGNKAEDKEYFWHSGYPSGLKKETFKKRIQRRPEEVFMTAVRRMLPRNSLGRQMLSKLKVYVGLKHPHEAQQPQPLPKQLEV